MKTSQTQCDPPDPETRTPAVAGTKAGAKDHGNRKTSENLNSTFYRLDAMLYTVDAWLSVGMVL